MATTATVQRTPVTILTGFLGSGKTTLLNRQPSASQSRCSTPSPARCDQRSPARTLGTTALSWNADSTRLLSAGQDGKTRVWDAESGVEKRAVACGATWVEKAAWSPQGDVWATIAGQTFRVWNKHGELLHEHGDHASTLADLQWRPSGRVWTIRSLARGLPGIQSMRG